MTVISMKEHAARTAGKIKRIALTGGIASGKSLIRKFLKELDIPTIDADDVVHDLYHNDPDLIQQIQAQFGPDYMTAEGAIDRKKLGMVVFENVDERRKLEALVHPKTRDRINTFFEEQQALQKPIGVAIIPLLFECSLEKNYDIVWLVESTEEQQLYRLMNNRGLSREEALARMESQMPLDEKKKRLTALTQFDIVDNTGSVEETQLEIQKLIVGF
ncbi:MAG: dephospho-CoA kinase [Candidatus Melainabacteria bacterium]